MPPEVISYVASAIVTNGRDLEGAVNRLLAHVTLTGAPLTVETAENAIRDLVRTQDPKRVKIDDIQKLVAAPLQHLARRIFCRRAAPPMSCVRARSPCICQRF